jgi:hypothetical protein
MWNVRCIGVVRFVEPCIGESIRATVGWRRLRDWFKKQGVA